MDSNISLRDRVHVAGAPDLPGLTFRRFRGELDYPSMVAVIEGSREVDGLERTDTVEDVARFYDNLVNCDPYQDMLFAEVDGEVVGMVLNYSNAEENREYGRKRGYTETICVRRPWHRRGLARALLAQSFRVLQELGLTEAALSVDAENPSGALRLYTSIGFIIDKQNAIYRKPLSRP